VHRTMDISPLDEIPIAATSLTSDLSECAILLDIDGTILDIAPAPQEVWVPPPLRQTLARLQELTGGALALVSGRQLNDIDTLFAPLELAAIGGHGVEIRRAVGENPYRYAEELSAALKRKLAALTNLGPGILAEDKGYSLALHYRLAPEQGPALREAIMAICAATESADAVAVLPGKFVFEVKPAGIDKGRAVRELMRYAPFAERHPIFIGDDATDETVFGVIAQFGGLGFSVGRIIPDTAGYFATPQDVRDWLARIVTDRRDGRNGSRP
jgi:trehalose 6-phosphate phosphatase